MRACVCANRGPTLHLLLVRELKSLKTDFQEMAKERFDRKQKFRREAVAQGLLDMAAEAEKLEAEEAETMGELDDGEACALAPSMLAKSLTP